MSNAVRIWQITEGNRLQELKNNRLDLESRLEDWIEQEIGILSNDLMIIGSQVATAYNTFIDLLCIDIEGDLAVLELKRDQTPRDTVAQALDYASWVRDLSHDAVCEIADTYFKKQGGLEEAFKEKFGEPLPDVLNANHRIFIVASRMDASTERIVTYLSESHGVGINVAEFQYYLDATGKEFVSRLFLIEPEVQQEQMDRAGTSKRRKVKNRQELEESADLFGVGEIYRYLSQECSVLFDGSRTTGTSLAYTGKKIIEGYQNNVIFSLIPCDSLPEKGLKFQVFLWRLAQFFKVDESEVLSLLPGDKHVWSYGPPTTEEWSGFEGYFASRAEAEVFVAGISDLKNRTTEN